MTRSCLATILCSAIGLIVMSGIALADIIARYDCTPTVAASQEPIGDRKDHDIVSFEYTCRGVEGLLKDGVLTAVVVSEWDDLKGTYLASVDTHRAPGGFAVGQLVEGTASILMDEGKAVGVEASGKTVFKFASGTLAAIAGRTAKFKTKPGGFGKFQLEFTD